MEKRIDINYYPGFLRKAISFTIDDGNYRLDKKFIDYVKPAGIKGSFNLIPSSINDKNREIYISLYSEYEIANHQMHHPMSINEDYLPVSDEPFDPDTANPDMLYKTETDGLYHYNVRRLNRWFKGAYPEDYLRFVKEGREVLEKVFCRPCKDYVWPYGKQKRPELLEAISKMGYRSVRGSVYDGFDLPSDRMNWGFYATYQNMLERAEKFDTLADDGSLKAFIFGVHAHDFENSGRWDVLEEFCKIYGNRPSEFYYATVGEIFDTEDAIKAAEITDSFIKNNSDIALYAKIGEQKTVIEPHSTYFFH